MAGLRDEAVEAAYTHAARDALTAVVGRHRSRRKLQKRLDSYAPDPDDEAAVAKRFAMPTGDMRRLGYQLDFGGREDEQQAMEDLAARFCQRFTTEYPQLQMDPDRLTSMCWLLQVSSPDMFAGTNALRAALEEHAASGSTERLRHGVRQARRSMEAMAAAESKATVGEVVLGEDDWRVRATRTRVAEELDRLEGMLGRARPVLEEHGLADPALFPDR